MHPLLFLENESLYLSRPFPFPVEFARQNARVNKRLAEADKDQKKADRKHKRAEAAKAKRKAYTIETIKYVAVRAFITAALAAAVTADLASLYLFIPVFVICLSGACLRLGKWFGRSEKK